MAGGYKATSSTSSTDLNSTTRTSLQHTSPAVQQQPQPSCIAITVTSVPVAPSKLHLCVLGLVSWLAAALLSSGLGRLYKLGHHPNCHM